MSPGVGWSKKIAEVEIGGSLDQTLDVVRVGARDEVDVALPSDARCQACRRDPSPSSAPNLLCT